MSALGQGVGSERDLDSALECHIVNWLSTLGVERVDISQYIRDCQSEALKSKTAMFHLKDTKQKPKPEPKPKLSALDLVADNETAVFSRSSIMKKI